MTEEKKTLEEREREADAAYQEKVTDGNAEADEAAERGAVYDIESA
ncbi:MAG: hypothetical protein HFJ75_08545 [Eggerthellaceae bacterium]|nr:hypothetical protein [Eggerthellaceae bacterium]